MRRASVGASLVLLFLLPAAAHGQPTGPRPIAGPQGGPARRAQSGPYKHDGFYARVALGPGLFLAESGTEPDGRHFSGGAVAAELALGGSPIPGVALGGALMTNQVFALSAEDDVIDGDEPTLDDVALSLDALGFFVDVYPLTTGGLHFQVFVGPGYLNRGQSGDPVTPFGTVLELGGGYEWFVAGQLSVGVLGRVAIAALEIDETGGVSTDVSAYVPALLATATYH